MYAHVRNYTIILAINVHMDMIGIQHACVTYTLNMYYFHMLVFFVTGIESQFRK